MSPHDNLDEMNFQVMNWCYQKRFKTRENARRCILMRYANIITQSRMSGFLNGPGYPSLGVTGIFIVKSNFNPCDMGVFHNNICLLLRQRAT